MADEMVWMRFPPNNGKAQFPPAAVDAWAARGWERCDAPTDADPALVEHVPLARVAIVPQIDNGIALTAADPDHTPEAKHSNKKTEK